MIAPDNLKDHYAAIKARIAAASIKKAPESAELEKPQPTINYLIGAPPMNEEVSRSVRFILMAYGLTWHDAFVNKNSGQYIACRSAIYWMLRCRSWSYSRIGSLCKKDHTTIVHSVAKMNIYASKDRPSIGKRKKSLVAKYCGVEK